MAAHRNRATSASGGRGYNKRGFPVAASLCLGARSKAQFFAKKTAGVSQKRPTKFSEHRSATEFALAFVLNASFADLSVFHRNSLRFVGRLCQTPDESKIQGFTERSRGDASDIDGQLVRASARGANESTALHHYSSSAICTAFSAAPLSN